MSSATLTQTVETHSLAVVEIIQVIHKFREELAQRVTNRLIEHIPVVGITPLIEDKQAKHKQNMAITARRFHEMVRAGTTVNWKLVTADFKWVDRKLSTMGVTREHHQLLIDSYFEEVLQLRAWTEAEQKIIRQIARDMHQAAIQAYPSSPASSKDNNHTTYITS